MFCLVTAAAVLLAICRHGHEERLAVDALVRSTHGRGFNVVALDYMIDDNGTVNPNNSAPIPKLLQPLLDRRLFTHVEHVTLAGESGPDGIVSLRNMPYLRRIVLSGKAFNDTHLPTLSKCLGQLEELSIVDTRVTTHGFKSISLPRRLRLLNLYATPVGDPVLPVIAELDTLEVLVLSGTAITDQGLTSIRTLASLRELYISDTQITDAGLRALNDMHCLKLLSLRGSCVTSDGVAVIRRRLPGCTIAE